MFWAKFLLQWNRLNWNVSLEFSDFDLIYGCYINFAYACVLVYTFYISLLNLNKILSLHDIA